MDKEVDYWFNLITTNCSVHILYFFLIPFWKIIYLTKLSTICSYKSLLFLLLHLWFYLKPLSFFLKESFLENWLLISLTFSVFSAVLLVPILFISALVLMISSSNLGFVFLFVSLGVRFTFFENFLISWSRPDCYKIPSYYMPNILDYCVFIFICLHVFWVACCFPSTTYLWASSRFVSYNWFLVSYCGGWKTYFICTKYSFIYWDLLYGLSCNVSSKVFHVHLKRICILLTGDGMFQVHLI